jgi:uncharacterized membrane protein YccC
MSQDNNKSKPTPKDKCEEIWRRPRLWKVARRTVDNLQRRIAKCIERNELKKAKQLAGVTNTFNICETYSRQNSN